MSDGDGRTGTVTRSDIEGKLQEIRGEVDSTRQRARLPVLAIGAVVAVGAVGVAYMLGRRRAKKVTTIVEVKKA